MSTTKTQGEGDYESTRKYNADTKQFMDSHDVSDVAKRAAPGSREEGAKLEQAEKAGRSHAKGGREAESWPKDKQAGGQVGQAAGNTAGGGPRSSPK